MFRSFRRKPTQKEESPPPLRSSPSLPELSSPGIPWPEDLVDMAAIRATPPPEGAHKQGAAKTSLSSSPVQPIPWHKPFRTADGVQLLPATTTTDGDGATTTTTISALYMSPAHQAAWRSANNASPALTARPSISHRRARTAPPQFNIMIAGAQGAGKTSLARLLLDTADVAPSATAAHRAALERFLGRAPRRTSDFDTVTVEIAESRFERVLLSVTDTPGLDLRAGRELTLDRQVSALVRRVEDAFAETMSEESKVVRQSKGDRHVHLVIYIIDPASIMTAAERHEREHEHDTAAQRPPLPSSTVSTSSHSHAADESDATPPLTDDTSSDPDDDVDEREQYPLTLAPADIRVLRRLAVRTNILPIIGHADSLTDARLRAVKDTVKRELARAELGFGVLAPSSAVNKEAAVDAGAESDGGPERGRGSRTTLPRKAATDNGHAGGRADMVVDDTSDGEDEGESKEEHRSRSRSVIRVRTGRRPSVTAGIGSQTSRARSRSRSRLDLASEARDDREPAAIDPADTDSVANARFNGAAIARAGYGALLPFAVVAPEPSRRRRRARDDESEVGDEEGSRETLQSPTSRAGGARSGGWAEPEDLRGVFTRTYRWGAIDVLEGAHCDFAALRTAVMSTHMKVYVTRTREVLYERFRTEKLLVRRATRKIGEKEAKKLLEDLLAEDASASANATMSDGGAVV